MNFEYLHTQSSQTFQCIHHVMTVLPISYPALLASPEPVACLCCLNSARLKFLLLLNTNCDVVQFEHIRKLCAIEINHAIHFCEHCQWEDARIITVTGDSS